MAAIRATGKVARMYVRHDQTLIRLEGLTAEETPGGENYFYLLPGDDNYNAQYSLILVAAANRYNLLVRVFGEIKPATATDPGENAHINYLMVDWD